MKEVLLNACFREEKGTSSSRRLRNEGFIPAVMYGSKENMLIEVNSKEFKGILHTSFGENAIINLHITKEGKKTINKKVFIKEVQHHPLSDGILHVDFYHFTQNKEIETKIPVTVKGEAKGVIEQAGGLDHVLWEVEVECFPTDIPENFEVDVSNLMIGDSIHVKDLSVSPKIKVITDMEQVVVCVVPPKKSEGEEEKPPEEEITEPELIKKERKKDDEEAGEVKEEKKETIEKEK